MALAVPLCSSSFGHADVLSDLSTLNHITSTSKAQRYWVKAKVSSSVSAKKYIWQTAKVSGIWLKLSRNNSRTIVLHSLSRSAVSLRQSQETFRRLHGPPLRFAKQFIFWNRNFGEQLFEVGEAVNAINTFGHPITSLDCYKSLVCQEATQVVLRLRDLASLHHVRIFFLLLGKAMQIYLNLPVM